MKQSVLHGHQAIEDSQYITKEQDYNGANYTLHSTIIKRYTTIEYSLNTNTHA